MELYWNFFGKINPAGFLHMFSLRVVSNRDSQRIRISPRSFHSNPVSPSQAPKYVGLCLAKFLLPHQVVTIKDHYDGGSQAPRLEQVPL